MELPNQIAKPIAKLIAVTPYQYLHCQNIISPHFFFHCTRCAIGSNEELPYMCDYPNCPGHFKSRCGKTLHFGSEHSARRGSVVAMSYNLSCIDNPFEPSPDSIIDSLSDTVNDMLGLDVSRCYSPEAELLQHLSQKHLVPAELCFLMDSAGAPKYLLDRIIFRLRVASIHRGIDLLSGLLSTRNTLMERLLSVASVPAPVSVPVALETGQMTDVLTNCVPSLFQRHLLTDAYSGLSNLNLPDLASSFSS
jgi:hypothetical protein